MILMRKGKGHQMTALTILFQNLFLKTLYLILLFKHRPEGGEKNLHIVGNS